MLDWRALPLRLAATLAAGLPEESRSRMKLCGQKVPLRIQLLALNADALHRLEWRMFGPAGSKQPPSVLADLLDLPEARPGGDVQSYDSPEEFEAARAAILEGGG